MQGMNDGKINALKNSGRFVEETLMLVPPKLVKIDDKWQKEDILDLYIIFYNTFSVL